MLVEDVNFCPRCGTPLGSRKIGEKVRPVCPHCEWIFFPDPKVAAGVLIQKEDQVLLVRRANNPKRGFWTLPVGFVDAGENPAKAAERECFEETGLHIRVTELLEVLSGQEHPRGAHIIIFYRGVMIDGNMTAGDDVDQVGFFALDSLPPMAFKTTRIIIGSFVEPGTW
jgi:8-oxo-dGTP diphosphatase